jgi:hypothetical protein
MTNEFAADQASVVEQPVTSAAEASSPETTEEQTPPATETATAAEPAAAEPDAGEGTATDTPAEETEGAEYPLTEEPEEDQDTQPEEEPPPPPPPSFVRPYVNSNTGEVRELDDVLIFWWKQSGNPKGDEWSIYEPPAPPEPIPAADWESFEQQALSSSSLKQIFPKITEVNPVAMSLLGAALLKAKGGSSDDFARIWLKIITDTEAAGFPLPVDLLETFVNVAKAYHLPEEFVNALKGVALKASATEEVIDE